MSTAVTEPPVETKQSKAPAKRGYVVLRKSGDTWAVLHGTDKKPIDATNDRQAIGEALDRSNADDRTGTCVAVPSRSWRPLTRGLKSVQKEVWS